MPRGLGTREEEDKDETVVSTPPDIVGPVTVVTEDIPAEKPKEDVPAEKPKEGLIRVQPVNFDGKVVLWETDVRHPKGEIFIVGEDKVFDVFPTPAVLSAISKGNLRQVNWNS